jgi:hypothetical protein
VPDQPEPGRREVRAQHPATHGPDGGIWHLISVICRVRSRMRYPRLGRFEGWKRRI